MNTALYRNILLAIVVICIVLITLKYTGVIHRETQEVIHYKAPDIPYQ